MVIYNNSDIKYMHIASQTYSTDRLVPDSAATATAPLRGEKARYGTVGLNQQVARGDCDGQHGNELTSVVHKAMAEGG